MLKGERATRHALTDHLEGGETAILRSAGISTVEDLLGAISVDATAVLSLAPSLDLPSLQADVYGSASASYVEASRAHTTLGLGAVPPPEADVERIASLSTFRAAVAESEATARDEPDDEGQPVALTVDLRDRLGPIRDQGPRGTCVGHACAAVMEHLFSGTGHLSLSPQFLYFHAKQLDGLPPTSEGTFVRSGLQAAVDIGAATEETWPYEPDVLPGDLTHGKPPAEATASAAEFRAHSWTNLGARDVRAVRGCLDGGTPVALAVPVYRNWHNNPAVQLTGVIPLPLPTSPLEGGHAVCAVGYGFDDDVPGGWFFVIRNSWGGTWGAESALGAGYGALPFVYLSRYGWEAGTAIVARANR